MKSVIAAVVFVALAATIARAGTTGCLIGNVVDFGGKPLANVAVSITSSSAACTTRTDAKGEFRCLSLPPGTYLATLELQHYNPAAFAGVVVEADTTLRLKFRLTLALATVTDRCYRCFPVPKGFGSTDTVDTYIVDRRSFPNFDDRLIRIGELLKTVPGVVTVP